MRRGRMYPLGDLKIQIFSNEDSDKYKKKSVSKVLSTNF